MHAFLSSADYFFKINFFKTSSINSVIVSNSLDPDQAGHVVVPDLAPNCLRRQSAGNLNRH